MSSISIHTSTTSRIGSYTAPSNAYIITVVLIGIIIIILMYFCISENSRNVMIVGFYWFCLLILKIILFVPALVVLLYCYIYKAFVFIGKKIKNKSKIDIYLQNSVVINNIDSITVVSTDASSDMINMVFRFYTC